MPDDRNAPGRRLPALKRPQRPTLNRPGRLDTPVDSRRGLLPGYDPERLGRLSERVARFLGTGRFIVYMTIFVGVWLAWNWLAPVHLQFDPRSLNFTLLTLLLSLQASYAAPLILLAQNRQDDRDRVNQDADRRNDAQLRADLDFVSREVAALRMALGEVATRDYLRSELRGVSENLAELLGLDDEAQKAQAESAKRQAKKAEKIEKQRVAATATAVADAAAKAVTAAVAEQTRGSGARSPGRGGPGVPGDAEPDDAGARLDGMAAVAEETADARPGPGAALETESAGGRRR